MPSLCNKKALIVFSYFICCNFISLPSEYLVLCQQWHEITQNKVRKKVSTWVFLLGANKNMERALKVEHTPLISKECGTVVRLIKKLSQVDF